MSAATLAPPTVAARPATNKWLVTVSVTFGTLMGAIDSSIVNVALPQIRGAVGATVQEITWITTGFAIATVIVMPLTAFLGRLFGQKRVYMSSLVLFVAGSALCGVATTPPAARRLPRDPGVRRRRAPADRAGHPAPDLPAQGAGDGDGALRHGGHDRPGHRPDARRLHRRQLPLVVDLLHQPARGRARPVHGLAVRARARGHPRRERGRRGASSAATWTGTASRCSPSGSPRSSSSSRRGSRRTGSSRGSSSPARVARARGARACSSGAS